MELAEFRIIREDWNVLELEDKAILRIRPVILFLVQSETGGDNQGLKVRWNTQIAVWGPEKGDPSEGPIPVEKIRENIVEENLQFRFLQEGQSEYTFEDGNRLFLKVTPVRFDKSSLFDKDGERAYLVSNQLTIYGAPPVDVEEE